MELTCVLNLGLNSFAFGLRVDFLTCLQVDDEKVQVKMSSAQLHALLLPEKCPHS